jgi:uncharacterized protein
MRIARLALPLLLLLTLTGCGYSNDATALLTTEDVQLPDGAHIHAEVKRTTSEKARGMMYRDSLPSDQGMLFLNAQPERSAYWMANCRFPLDIIWMNAARQVVEISPSTPPCPAGGNDCPSYGGHEPAQYVLELNGGEAQKHGVRVGTTINFNL